MRFVQEAATRRPQLHRRPKPYGCRMPCDGRHADPRDLRVLDATHLRLRRAHEARDVCLAHAGRDSGEAELTTDVGEDPAGEARGLILRPSSVRHRRTVAADGYPWLMRRLPRRAGNGQARGWLRRLPGEGTNGQSGASVRRSLAEGCAEPGMPGTKRRSSGATWPLVPVDGNPSDARRRTTAHAPTRPRTRARGTPQRPRPRATPISGRRMPRPAERGAPRPRGPRGWPAPRVPRRERGDRHRRHTRRR